MKLVIIAVLVATSLTFGACNATTDRTGGANREGPKSNAAARPNRVRGSIVDNHFKYLPSGEGPFPTIIAIPGCSGIALASPAEESNLPGLQEDDRLFRRHYPRMAERFRAQGYAVLLIHVHGAEGLVKACGGEFSAERIAEYIDASVAWAKELDFVDKTRIHVIGWSMGGGGALTWLTGPPGKPATAQSVIAVYPPCKVKDPMTKRIPLLLLLGGADDIAEPTYCDKLVAASGSNPMITARRYPGARHGFDIADAPPVMDIGNGKTIGYQKRAAEATWNEIMEFLARNE